MKEKKRDSIRQLNSNYYNPYEQAYDGQDQSLRGEFNFSLFLLLQLRICYLDCHGKVCLYNGELDLRTCQCQCSSYASGPQCERRKLL